MGYLLLAGGAEFGGQMAEVDRRAIVLAGGPSAKISIIPAAAAPDHNHQRAGQNGVHWFQSLGAAQVTSLPLIDRASANNPVMVAALRQSQFIYLLGGFTHYLGQTLKDSAAWQAIETAYQAGAVVGGSSAGAMVLTDYYYNPPTGQVETGLGLVPNACVLPHHNTFGRQWAPRLKQLLPRCVLIGLDEQTGMLNDGPEGQWQVYGRGGVTLYHQGQRLVFSLGQAFALFSNET